MVILYLIYAINVYMINTSFSFFQERYISLISGFFRSTRLFIRIIRLHLPANQLKTFPTLSATLGQYGINIVEFIADCEKKTHFFDDGFMLRVSVFLLPEKKFFTEIKKFSSFELISNFSFTLTENSVIRKLSRLNLYRMLLIKAAHSPLPLFTHLLIIFGTLRSFNRFKLVVD